MSLTLDDISDCFHGVVPGALATCSADGTPNVTVLSHVEKISSTRVALSCQFFNKTARNVRENPRAKLQVYDPATFEAYALDLRYTHSETEGPLFESMAARIQAIASHTGMIGIFRLVAADVFEVLSVEKKEAYLEPPGPGSQPVAEPSPGLPTELRALQVISARINHARDLEELLDSVLEALEQHLGFAHSMVLLPDARGVLVALGSRGYGGEGVGAEVAPGDGLIGVVAERRRPTKVAGVGQSLSYGRAVRDRVSKEGGAVEDEIPLPGLPDAQAQLAIPLVVRDRLVGVLALEARDPLAFEEWHDAFLEVIANQIAMGIEHATLHSEPVETSRRTFTFYQAEEQLFVDGEYLIKNVPARILWKVLTEHEREGKTEFSNKELRLDPTLGLPELRDNLESRLILLRKRLEQKVPGLRLNSSARGKFTLELTHGVELETRP